jgi:germination protein M
MNKKKLSIILALLLMMVSVLCGCTPKDTANTDKEPAAKTYTAVLFFTNQQYVNSGDESLDKLVAEQRKLKVKEDGNIGLAMLEALKTTKTEGSGTAVGEDIKFLDVRVSKDDPTLVIVDISSKNLSGGSLEEVLLIDQVVETLLHNDAYVNAGKTTDKVQFLVDGKVAESLMGHVDASKPFTGTI